MQDLSGATPVSICVHCRHYACLDVLVSEGADLELPVRPVKADGGAACTALLASSLLGYEEIAWRLVIAGADINGEGKVR